MPALYRNRFKVMTEARYSLTNKFAKSLVDANYDRVL